MGVWVSPFMHTNLSTASECAHPSATQDFFVVVQAPKSPISTSGHRRGTGKKLFVFACAGRECRNATSSRTSMTCEKIPSVIRSFLYLTIVQVSANGRSVRDRADMDHQMTTALWSRLSGQVSMMSDRCKEPWLGFALYCPLAHRGIH